MTSQTSTPTLQVCRNCGGGSPIDVHFCQQCTKILSLGRHGDYFSFLGVPRKLNIDTAQLEREFYRLSRKLHPDRIQYTYWDYFRNAFDHNWGWRIDHILATAPLAETCRLCDVDLEPRKSPSASDHTVCWAEFDAGL